MYKSYFGAVPFEKVLYIIKRYVAWNTLYVIVSGFFVCHLLIVCADKLVEVVCRIRSERRTKRRYEVQVSVMHRFDTMFSVTSTFFSKTF